jgi:hypothetical protein
MKLCARAAHTAQPNHGLEDLQVGSVHGIPLFFTYHTMTDAAFPYCRGEALAQVTDLFALDGIAHRKRVFASARVRRRALNRQELMC